MAKVRRFTVSETRSKKSNHKELVQDVEQLKQEIAKEIVEKFREENKEEVSWKTRHNGVEEVRLGSEPVLWFYDYMTETKGRDIEITLNYTRALTLPEEEEVKEFWTQAPMGTFGT